MLRLAGRRSCMRRTHGPLLLTFFLRIFPCIWHQYYSPLLSFARHPAVPSHPSHFPCTITSRRSQREGDFFHVSRPRFPTSILPGVRLRFLVLCCIWAVPSSPSFPSCRIKNFTQNIKLSKSCSFPRTFPRALKEEEEERKQGFVDPARRSAHAPTPQRRKARFSSFLRRGREQVSKYALLLIIATSSRKGHSTCGYARWGMLKLELERESESGGCPRSIGVVGIGYHLIQVGKCEELCALSKCCALRRMRPTKRGRGPARIRGLVRLWSGSIAECCPLVLERSPAFRTCPSFPPFFYASLEIAKA